MMESKFCNLGSWINMENRENGYANSWKIPKQMMDIQIDCYSKFAICRADSLMYNGKLQHIRRGHRDHVDTKENILQESEIPKTRFNMKT